MRIGPKHRLRRQMVRLQQRVHTGLDGSRRAKRPRRRLCRAINNAIVLAGRRRLPWCVRGNRLHSLFLMRLLVRRTSEV